MHFFTGLVWFSAQFLQLCIMEDYVVKSTYLIQPQLLKKWYLWINYHHCNGQFADKSTWQIAVHLYIMIFGIMNM